MGYFLVKSKLWREIIWHINLNYRVPIIYPSVKYAVIELRYF